MNIYANMLQTLKKNHRLPGQLVIQMTDQCNGSCPQCGMRASENFKRSTLSVDTIKRIIDHASKNNVGALSFTGGEPMLFLDELVELLSYAGDKNIAYTRTGTNGFFFKNSDAPDYLDRISVIAKRLARTPVRNFWISIDSPDPKMHERMRGFEGVIGCPGLLP